MKIKRITKSDEANTESGGGSSSTSTQGQSAGLASPIDVAARAGISRLATIVSDLQSSVSGVSSSVSSLSSDVASLKQHVSDTAIDAIQSNVSSLYLKVQELERKLEIAFEKLEHHGIGVLGAIKAEFEKGVEAVEGAGEAVVQEAEKVL
jgi:outer membrane murein-binding lipoprotein Lpp